jgi:catechol 2,3-dioxygenase-like lactoylglutathione lyase family enzyme
MASPKIEHVNISVRDPARAARLMDELFGWKVRWQGPALNGGHTIHVGSADQYLALYTPRETDLTDADFAKGRPLNHVGVEVEDIAGTEARVVAAGLVPFNHGDYEPGRRFYFLDPDGIEFEVVSYR